jgi:hypothetical protein
MWNTAHVGNNYYAGVNGNIYKHFARSAGPLRVKTSKAPTEQMFSGLPPKADLRGHRSKQRRQRNCSVTRRATGTRPRAPGHYYLALQRTAISGIL